VRDRSVIGRGLPGRPMVIAEVVCDQAALTVGVGLRTLVPVSV